ncbi:MULTISPECIES: nuclear transport factor 2 family protein [unclassified Novosphingobium]|uniref:nuclear transport factor 2 family protein n=1 Tax=unclassified Novosphingobium TaxID=2644732 RepID=UPI00086D10B2|nr:MULTISPECIES: nuclear transport factor 2 family protein [unclassified Novosphingobium]MBN9143690.1 nuclear transport factor 2 family protein [Novosphingobium sp.]MDR6706949.1 hypothetical protein [Novosphingobium sp. 1748]NKI99682.1 hypothetical protein [Novosphingobium sp. SG707]ODU84308.1 MAG: polyketide cyclase [Novosphingobium sp. SCN 63-17]OJX92849.1 MAG: polyketide cyclase [Novosphingobium sp. 63-713]
MDIELPLAIARYFAADQSSDGADIGEVFAEHAVVRDERQTYTGREAIRQWKAAASAKYSYAAQPFALAEDGEARVVTAHLVGNFPGSPIDLRYRFTLDGDKIASLEIAP